MRFKQFSAPAWIALVTIFIIGISVMACSKSGASGYGNGGNNGGIETGNAVSIKNFAFSVATLNVANGTTVKWTNNDATAHTVTADDGSFDSGNIAPGGTFSHKFTTAATVAYHCKIHTNMKANVVVKN